MFGSSLNGFGIHRLMKMLRHEAPPVALAAKRLGANGKGLHVFKVANGGAVGRLALARVLGDGSPKVGAHGKRVLFLHPKDFCGTLTELEEA